ncbi:MAG: AAA family ATPase [Spirochaetales bacterium]|nr:AAA family ATPase [Spirochaetales bacterium]
MLLCSRFDITEELYSENRMKILRAVDSENGQPVILKHLYYKNVTAFEYNQIKENFLLLKNIRSSHILRVKDLVWDEIPEEYGIILAYEDVLAVPLINYIQNTDFSTQSFLETALDLTAGLEDIHMHKIIHSAIKPVNILIDTRYKIKYMDFGIFSPLVSQNEDVFSYEYLDKTLPYIAPEQTGKISRSTDTRTDLYSLGIVLYEMITKKRPFESDDPVELVHSHIAREPVPPDMINTALNPAISRIILKLLAKNVEDRYQNASGLKRDFEICLEELSTRNAISIFDLGVYDRTIKFQKPMRLYGREKEVESLEELFRNTQNGDNAIVIVSGTSGIGKTTLVQELKLPVIKGNGYFITGKYEKNTQNVPYSAIINAFNQLLKKIMELNDYEKNLWREKITKSLEQNLSIIINFLPELKNFIEQPVAVKDTDIHEAQNRFNIAVRNFVKVFASPKHPLVMALDDAQWIDASSITLIKTLFTDTELSSFFLIITLREESSISKSVLSELIHELENSLIPFQKIFLTPLEIINVNEWISDTLNTTMEKTQALTNLLYNKTWGIPLNVKTALQTLFNENLFKLDPAFIWSYDMEEINKIQFNANIFELLFKRVKELEEPTLNALKTASCLGNTFKLELLSELSGIPQNRLSNILKPACNLELLICSQNDYCFIHDKIQESLYNMIPEPEKLEHHKRISRIFSSLPEDEINRNIANYIDYINFAARFMDNREEMERIARLNLLAGKMAETKAAHQPAVHYYDFGIKLLEDDWDTAYEVLFNLYLGLARCHYLLGHFELMEKYIINLMEHAVAFLDTIPAYEIKIHYLITFNKPDYAVNLALDVLKQLNIFPPMKPGLFHNMIFSRTISSHIRYGNTMKAEVVDRKIKAAIRIMAQVFSAAYVSHPELLDFLSQTMAHLTKKYGLTTYAGYAYTTGALLLCGMNKLKFGTEIGEYALYIQNQLSSQKFKCQTLFNLAYFVTHWKMHLKKTISILQEALHSGLEHGNFNFAAYSANTLSVLHFMTGMELGTLLKEIDSNINTVYKMKQEKGLNHFNLITKQTVLSLLGYSEDATRLAGEAYNETKMIPLHEEARDLPPLYYTHFNKAYLCYLLKKDHDALYNIRMAEEYIDGIRSTPHLPLHYFYRSLILLRGKPRKRYGKEIREGLARLKEWARFCPANHRHKFLLVKAEYLLLTGKWDRALPLFNRALVLSHQQGFIQEEALTAEQLSAAYMRQNDPINGRVYLNHAYRCYSEWGAKAKIKLLEAEQSHNLYANQHMTAGTLPDNISMIDLNKIVDAFKIVISEKEHDTIPEKIISIICEIAGAQKVFFVANDGGHLKVLLKKDIDARESHTHLSSPLTNYAELPELLITQSIQTGNPIILSNGSVSEFAADDKYLQQNNIKSVLCLPVSSFSRPVSRTDKRKRNSPYGIFYLENNRINNAFTQNTIDIINIILWGFGMRNDWQYSLDLQVKETRARQHLEEEFHKIQNQLLQAQKLNAIGLLTGGIAHDFNNILTIIKGSITLLKSELKETGDSMENISILENAANKGAELTRQLLVFTGQSYRHFKTINLNKIIRETLVILKRTIKKEINIKEELEANLYPIQAVENTMEQIIMNLVINARDAMPAGGTILIKTENRDLHDENHSGRHIVLTIRDTGTGMDEETIKHIFEPFFTTKKSEKGYGLGMAIVRNIIKQQNGWIDVKSALNAGTSFTIFLPVDRNTRKQEEAKPIPSTGKGEVILVVGDANEGRNTTVKALQKYGYSVKTAASYREAMEIIASATNGLHLVFTNIVLPDRSGIQLMTESRQIYPQLKFLLTSTSEEPTGQSEIIRKSNAVFIPKPFNLNDMLDAVNEALKK